MRKKILFIFILYICHFYKTIAFSSLKNISNKFKEQYSSFVFTKEHLYWLISPYFALIPSTFILYYIIKYILNKKLIVKKKLLDIAIALAPISYFFFKNTLPSLFELIVRLKAFKNVIRVKSDNKYNYNTNRYINDYEYKINEEKNVILQHNNVDRKSSFFVHGTFIAKNKLNFYLKAAARMFNLDFSDKKHKSNYIVYGQNNKNIYWSGELSYHIRKELAEKLSNDKSFFKDLRSNANGDYIVATGHSYGGEIVINTIYNAYKNNTIKEDDKFILILGGSPLTDESCKKIDYILDKNKKNGVIFNSASSDVLSLSDPTNVGKSTDFARRTSDLMYFHDKDRTVKHKNQILGLMNFKESIQSNKLETVSHYELEPLSRNNKDFLTNLWKTISNQNNKEINLYSIIWK
jgi:hypothetical protein